MLSVSFMWVLAGCHISGGKGLFLDSDPLGQLQLGAWSSGGPWRPAAPSLPRLLTTSWENILPPPRLLCMFFWVSRAHMQQGRLQGGRLSRIIFIQSCTPLPLREVVSDMMKHFLETRTDLHHCSEAQTVGVRWGRLQQPGVRVPSHTVWPWPSPLLPSLL